MVVNSFGAIKPLGAFRQPAVTAVVSNTYTTEALLLLSGQRGVKPATALVYVQPETPLDELF